MSTNFPHLHVHTYYSLLDGVFGPVSYLKACEELEIPAIAFTDHGSMGSHAEASVESSKYKTKVLLGLEAYVSPDVEKIQKVRQALDKTKDKKKQEIYKAFIQENRRAYHLVLIARNAQGYKNLIAINNDSWREGFYYRNRTDFAHLKKHSEGLVVLSACQSGVVSALLLNGKKERAIQVAKLFKKIYGGNFFLELQFLDMPIQDELNKMLVELGLMLEIPFVLTNDVHYIKKGDHKLQSILLHLATKNKFKMDSESNFLKTLADAEKDFIEHKSVPKKIFHQAIDNLFRIVDSANYLVETGKLYFPSFDHTTHFLYEQFPISDKAEFFKKIIIHRAKQMLKEKVRDPIYKARLSNEFSVLNKLGGIDYFLIVDDLLHFVRSNGAFSMIRGSANGSLIAFVFGFGLIDPIRHSIMFERFVSKYRSLNDIDIDIDVRSEFRSKAVEYLRKRYGSDRVISVGTYGRMQLKSAIKDVTRVLKERLDERIENAKTEKDADRLAEMQKDFTFQVINKVTSVMDGDLTVDTARQFYNIFDKWYLNNKKIMQRYIEPLIGNIKNVSLHPAGVIITPDSVDKILPIRTQVDPHSKERIISTMWENSHTGREDLNEIGVMALDILGVKTLSVVSEVMDLVKKTRGTSVDLYKLDLEDKKTLQMFNRKELTGVFQFSGGSASQIINMTKITEFNDLIVINALARPGALAAGADKTFAARKANPSLIEYDHHSLKNILNDSLGVIVFSEHILRTANEFAGLPIKEADKLRKIIKGKNLDLFKAYRQVFISGAMKKWSEEPDIKEVAKKIWKKFSQAGSYLFPRGHASSYALLGFICQYLKVHFPEEFFTCHLRYQPQAKYGHVKEVAGRIYSIQFAMPNINAPKMQFEAAMGKIWWPLTALKSVGDKAVVSIVKNAPFISIEDFLNRVDKRLCNKRVVTNLILAGAFKEFGNKRAVMMEYIRLRKDKSPDLPVAFTSKETMAVAMEDIFGFELQSLSSLYSSQLKMFKGLMGQKEYRDTSPGERVMVFGRISRLHVIQTKKGDNMAFVILKDGKSVFNITLFPESYELAKDYFKQGSVLVVSGVKHFWNKEDSIILNTDRSKLKLGFASGSWVKEL